MTLHEYLGIIVLAITFIVMHIKLIQIYKETKEASIKIKDHKDFYKVAGAFLMYYSMLLITLIMYLLGYDVS